MSYMRDVKRTDWPSYLKRASIERTFADVSAMVHAGGRECHTSPSLKYALAASILSANNRLDRNGWQVNAIRNYDRMYGHWPTSVEEYKTITRNAGFECSGNHAAYLLDLDRSYAAGALAELEHQPDNGHAWLLWRHAAVGLVRGIGNKTASMAAMLLWPYHSPLVVCDRHVVARLAFNGVFDTWGMSADVVYKRMLVNSPRGYLLYRRVERAVGNEKLRLGLEMPTAIWHWHTWDAWRSFVTAEDADNSHELLSPYWYPVAG